MNDIKNSMVDPTTSEDLSTFDGHHDTLRDRIARRAYSLYENRGCVEGFDLKDWLEAEREVLVQEDIH